MTRRSGQAVMLQRGASIGIAAYAWRVRPGRRWAWARARSGGRECRAQSHRCSDRGFRPSGREDAGGFLQGSSGRTKPSPLQECGVPRHGGAWSANRRSFPPQSDCMCPATSALLADQRATRGDARSQDAVPERYQRGIASRASTVDHAKRTGCRAPCSSPPRPLSRAL